MADQFTIDSKVMDSLQDTCRILASFREQLFADIHLLESLDQDWLASRFKKFHDHLEHHLNVFLRRIVELGEEPDYQADPVTGYESLTDLVRDTREETLGCLKILIGYRKSSTDSQLDGIVDMFEHVVQRFEKIYFKLNREYGLITKWGEDEYAKARVESD